MGGIDWEEHYRRVEEALRLEREKAEQEASDRYHAERVASAQYEAEQAARREREERERLGRRLENLPGDD